MVKHLTRYLLAASLPLACASPAMCADADDPHAARDARSVGRIPVPGQPPGFLFRSDVRAPFAADRTGLFEAGITPLVSHLSLQQHPMHPGNASHDHTSRSAIVTREFAYGVEETRPDEGYLYVISTAGLQAGYYVPDHYPDDKLFQHRKQFAVSGTIEPGTIAGAYHYRVRLPRPVEWIPNPAYAYEDTAPYIPAGNFKDVCGTADPTAAALCAKFRPAQKFVRHWAR